MDKRTVAAAESSEKPTEQLARDVRRKISVANWPIVLAMSDPAAKKNVLELHGSHIWPYAQISHQVEQSQQVFEKSCCQIALDGHEAPALLLAHRTLFHDWALQGV